MEDVKPPVELSEKVISLSLSTNITEPAFIFSPNTDCGIFTICADEPKLLSSDILPIFFTLPINVKVFPILE